MNHSQLKNLPAVDQLLRDPAVRSLADELEQREAGVAPKLLVGWAREAVEQCRRRILDGASFTPQEAADWVVSRLRQLAESDAGLRLGPVINGTGVLLHTNLGRAPLAPRAVERVRQAAGSANVELNLSTGKRCKRGERIAALLSELTGAESALVVNNCAAATMLVLQATAAGREVIVSRGQLVEIGGGFRLPEVFAAAGVILREVGTTNRTYVRDYEQAAGESTGAIIRVHRSNFRQSGFVTEPTIGELVQCRRPPAAAVIDDVGSGNLYDLSSLGIDEPNVLQSVSAGADITLFSGDKLFGGPQCGIVVGRRSWIDRMSASPMMRALRVDKLTLAALEATVEIHLAGDAERELPLLRMLHKTPEQIREQCESIRQQLSGDGRQQPLLVVPCESQIGGGAVPELAIDSFALQIQHDNLDGLARALRMGEPAVLPRLAHDRLLLDLRTVADEQLQPLTDRLRTLLGNATP